VPDYDKDRLLQVSAAEPAENLLADVRGAARVGPGVPATDGSLGEGLRVTPAGLNRIKQINELDGALVRGVAWTAAVKWLTQAITWGTTIVVARLLAPADYGLVGMAAIYINLLTLFSEFGIGTAVLTLQDLTDGQLAQLNTLSLLLGIFGAVVSAAAAVPLGWFFHAPNLPYIVVILSVGFIFSGLRTVPYALLQKEMRFKRIAMIEGWQSVFQGLLTLVLAVLGFGYWALVWGIFSFGVSASLLTLFWRRHRFELPRWASVREAIRYSRHIVVGRLSWAGYNDADFVVAGRVLGQAPLGAYTLAWTLAHTPLEKLTTLVNRVTPSVFARVQGEPESLRRYLRNITGVMALIIFPVTIGVALVAREFVPVVLGGQWMGVVLPLELLALHAVVRSNVILVTPLLNVIGEERLVMWNSLAALAVLPVSFYLASHWGTAGIAAVWVVVYPVLHAPLFSRVFRGVGLGRGEYFAALWPAISGCLVMTVAVLLVKFAMGQGWPLAARLAAEIGVGAAAYAVVLLSFHRNYLRGIQRFVQKSRAAAGSTPVAEMPA
jgi:O-antigen/teichoic acid export membrane protein